MKISSSKLLRPEALLDVDGFTMPLLYSAREDGLDDCAIVFIHGVRSNSIGTWGIDRHGYFWPIEMGIQTNCAVYCFQYLNSMTTAGRRAPLDIQETVIRLANFIFALRNQHKSILLVTHSFGGILAKSLFLFLSDSRDPGERELVDLLRGAYLISTPNYGNVFTLFPNVLLRPLAAPNFQLLRPGSLFLRDLHTNFLLRLTDKNGRHNMECATAGEQGRVLFVFRVDEKDARLSDQTPHYIDERNHIDICHTLASNDPLYLSILAFVSSRKNIAPVKFRMPL